MEEQSPDLLKLLNIPDDDSPQEQRNIISELLKSEETCGAFPRKDQILRTIDEAQELFFDNQGIAFKATQNLKAFIDKFGIEMEDFRQICYLGLWSAALTFDTTKNIKFSTWGYLISRQVVGRDLNRHYIRPGRIGQTVRILANNSSDEVILADFEDYKQLPVFEKILANEILSNLDRMLTPRIGDILVERIVWDMTLEECAIKRKITRERIRQLEASGLQKLKAIYHSGKAKLIH